MRRIVGKCTDVDERDAVGIRLEPAAAIDENQLSAHSQAKGFFELMRMQAQAAEQRRKGRFRRERTKR